MLSVGAGLREAQAAQPPSSTDDGYLWHPEQKPAPAPRPSPLQPGFQLSVFGGYGYNQIGATESSPETGEWLDPLGFGLGLRGRYQLALGLSLGLRASHHFGAPGDDARVSLGHVEAGWALPLGPLRGELFAGAGAAYTWSEAGELCMIGGACTPVEMGSPFSWTVELGLTLAYPFADRYFVAATGEAVALMEVFGLSGYASVGVTF